MSKARPFIDTLRDIEAGGTGWWSSEPGMGRVADGMAHRVDRLKAIGNGQVPVVAARAFNLLSLRR